MSINYNNISKIEQEAKDQLVIVNDENSKVVSEAQEMIDEIFSLDLASAQSRLRLLDKIDSLGDDIIKQSSTACSFLKIRMKDLAKLDDSSSDSQNIALKGIADLNIEMKRLDPSKIDFDEKGFLGRTALSIRRYFSRFETAETVISNIVKSLENGKRQLENDNKTLEIKQVELRNVTLELGRLTKYISYLGDSLSERIEVAKSESMDEELIKFIESQVLYAVLQKNEALQTQIIVNQQGYVAMEIVKKNNMDLIRNVKRASTTTVSALTTAVIVASALYNQKIVLKQIAAVNSTTDNMIDNTAKLLKAQGVEIQKQALNAGPSIEVLKEAFENTFAAIHEIETIKLEAIPIMKERIAQFVELTRKGEEEIRKIEATKA